MWFFKAFFLNLALFKLASGARILAVVPTPAFSHQVAFRAIWKELSLRGHQLTLLTTDPLYDRALTNITEIDLHFAYGLINKSAIIGKYKNSFLDVAEDVLEVRNRIYDAELAHPAVQRLIKDESVKFDLLIAEYVYPAFFMFKHRFNCPFIGVVSMDTYGLGHDILGNPDHPLLYPNCLTSFDNPHLSFKERVFGLCFYILTRYYLYVYMYPEQEKVAKKHFGEEMPSLLSAAQQIDMLFLTYNPLFFNVRPTVPAIVHLGATHIQPAKQLPKDLQHYMNNSKSGVIYFSLGTNAKSVDISKNTKKVIVDTFADLPYDVLWKFDEEEMVDRPKNVMVFKWLPQQDILRHPNLKLFITQGGLQSIEEAVYTHVPMVGMPFIGDQRFNVRKFVSHGFGLEVDHKTLTKDSFKHAIVTVINNPKYKENIRKKAELWLDQPMSGIERAVWWTEYVLRHKGAQHLRGPGYDLPLYQYHFLDIIGMLLLILIFVVFVLIAFLKFLCGRLRFKSQPKSKTE